MLYVVECAYTDPQSEAAWNTFYNQEKALLNKSDFG